MFSDKFARNSLFQPNICGFHFSVVAVHVSIHSPSTQEGFIHSLPGTRRGLQRTTAETIYNRSSCDTMRYDEDYGDKDAMWRWGVVAEQAVDIVHELCSSPLLPTQIIVGVYPLWNRSQLFFLKWIRFNWISLYLLLSTFSPTTRIMNFYSTRDYHTLVVDGSEPEEVKSGESCPWD